VTVVVDNGVVMKYLVEDGGSNWDLSEDFVPLS